MDRRPPPKAIDLTWLARIAAATRDRPTSMWLPPGQRLVGRRFNDPLQPEWMDDAEWELRDEHEEAATLRTATIRLKQILCEGASLSPDPEVRRSAER